MTRSLKGDVFRLRQVLLNLAGNAIKFTAQGEVVVEIEQVACGPERCEISFSVSDTGIGIAPEQQMAIFESFSQGEASTTRRSGGSGLGLTISRDIVSLMGGRLEVESELGRGSRFHFTLPFDLASEVAGEATQQPKLRASTRRERALIVDDNELARRALLKITRSIGWPSDEAVSGLDALDLLRRSQDGFPYDVIFIDWMMPHIDGWETAVRIRELAPAGTAILLMASAHGLAECSARTQAEPNVVDAVVLKPVTASAIVETVNEVRAPRGRDARAPSRPATPNRLGGLNVLVVDDFAINLQIASELLSLEGARVVVAESGADAIEKVLRSPEAFDVVLMDVQMPDMDGYETTRRLRELPNVSAKIVAMTANAMEPDEAACLAAGMDAYISKPIDVEVVVRTILSQTWQMRAVDVDSALRRMGSDRSLFATIAGRFVENAGPLVDELRAFLHIGALSDAQRVLHQLKGFAGTVGNVPLAEMASQLETELKRTSRLSDAANDLTRIETLVVAGNAELERFLRDFEAARASLEGAHEPGAAPSREEIVNLSTLLRERNLSALELYRKLAPALKATLPAERNAVLVAAMDGFDFAAAATVLGAAGLSS
jgi:CheY-like chemotaxis protein